MYSVVLLMALSGGGDVPAFGHHDGCSGCTGYVSCSGCCGGCSGCSGCCGGYVVSCTGCSHSHFVRAPNLAVRAETSTPAIQSSQNNLSAAEVG